MVTSRVPVNPDDQAVFWHQHPFSDAQRRKVLRVQELVRACSGNAERGR